MNTIVFNKNTIEFITVVNQYVEFCETCDTLSTQQILNFSQKILPLLYLKTSLLDNFNAHEVDLEDVVSESMYSLVASQFEKKLGENDIEVIIPDINQLKEPDVASLSELLADIYQDLKTVQTHYQTNDEEIMETALYYCKQNFEIYWGYRLIAAMSALHTLLYQMGEWWNDVKPKKAISLDEVDTSNWIITKYKNK